MLVHRSIGWRGAFSLVTRNLYSNKLLIESFLLCSIFLKKILLGTSAANNLLHGIIIWSELIDMKLEKFEFKYNKFV